MDRRLILREERDCLLAADALPDAVLAALERSYNRQLHLHWRRGGKELVLRSRGYVGQVALPEGWQLAIEPKVPLKRWVDLIEQAGELAAFRLQSRLVDCQSIEALFEGLLKLLATGVLQLTRQGLGREYRQRRGDCPAVRGRLYPGKGEEYRLRWDCRFAEHTADTPANRILAASLEALLGNGHGTESTRRQLRRALAAVGPQGGQAPLTPEQCMLPAYHRLNERYRPLHALCRFLMAACGPAIGGGGGLFASFLVHMPTVFEGFIAAWLARQWPGRLVARRQWYAPLDRGQRLAFRIDLVLTQNNGDPLAVVDTKYKNDRLPSPGDIQQVVAYAVRLGVRRAYLVYPSKGTQNMRMSVGQVEVRTLVYDVAEKPEKAAAQVLKALEEEVLAVA